MGPAVRRGRATVQAPGVLASRHFIGESLEDDDILQINISTNKGGQLGLRNV